MGQIISLPLRRKACWGLFGHPNPRTRVPEASMLTTRPPKALCFCVYRYKQLYLNNSELDTFSYEPFASQRPILSPTKIITFPPETPCILPYYYTPWCVSWLKAAVFRLFHIVAKKGLLASSCPSVCQNVSSRLPPGGIPLKTDSRDFYENLPRNPNLDKNMRHFTWRPK